MMIALSNAQLSINIVKQTLHEVSVFQNLYFQNLCIKQWNNFDPHMQSNIPI